MSPYVQRFTFALLLSCVLSGSLFAETSYKKNIDDYTGIWYNPDASGWGVTLSQSDFFIFATFFVYDKEGKPVWYTSEMSLQHPDYCYGFSIGPPPPIPPEFCGHLYRVESSSPPKNVISPIVPKEKRVGYAFFFPQSPTDAGIAINFDTPEDHNFSSERRIQQNIVRQTLTTPAGSTHCIRANKSYEYIGSAWYYPVKTWGTTTTESLFFSFSIDFRINDTNASTGCINEFHKKDYQIRLTSINPDDTNLPSPEACTIRGTSTVAGPYYVIKNADYSCFNNVPKDGKADLWFRFSKTGGMDGYWVATWTNEGSSEKIKAHGHFSVTSYNH